MRCRRSPTRRIRRASSTSRPGTRPTRRASSGPWTSWWVSGRLCRSRRWLRARLSLGGAHPHPHFRGRGARAAPPAPPHLPHRGGGGAGQRLGVRSEEHTSELQAHSELVCPLLLEKKK